MQEKEYQSPSECQHWQLLYDHYKLFKDITLSQLFISDHNRSKNHSIEFNSLFVDFSKNHFDEKTLTLLLGLAKEMELRAGIEAMFNGENVNSTEQRPALHAALRGSSSNLSFDGNTVQSMIDAELDKIEQFSQRVRNGSFTVGANKIIDTIIHIGIGGSDLGPRLVVNALKDKIADPITCHFVANIDATDINEALKKSSPESTLVILASKSFTTQETLANGHIARSWLKEHNCDPKEQLLAITSNNEAAKSFGIKEENIFSFWSWVGGRYSVWSSIGLPIAISLGMEQFRQFLLGAELLDKHFQTTELEKNIPVLLGLLDVWYANFYKAETLAVVPYDQSLSLFPDYLSQLIMESNGKSIDKNGKPVDYNTAPIVWGSVGSNAQHAFFQLLHQGTQFVPVDFLIACNAQHDYQDNHNALVANCIAQSEALMVGQEAEHEAQPYRNYSGNRPSTTLFYEQLDAKTLGMLLALYEHRTFVQAWIYNINPFDQWGVELGKKLATNLIREINSNNIDTQHDTSTQQLLRRFLKT